MNEARPLEAPLADMNTLISRFASLTPRRRVVVVSPTDLPTREVVEHCAARGMATFILTVERTKAADAHNLARRMPQAIEVVETNDLDSAAAEGVALVRAGRGDVLMKGGINTDRLLKAVLNKEHGLLPQGRVLTHLTLTRLPAYDKLLMFMDAAVIPAPDREQFKAMVAYGVDALHRLGVERPAVALIHFSEKTNPKFAYTLDYELLLQMGADSAFGNAVIGGPMDVKTACDSQSAQIKGIDSEVCGKADLLIFPNLAAGNTFYKTVSLFCNAPMAGVLCGTTVPVVVPSRADHDSSKLYSLALACLLA